MKNLPLSSFIITALLALGSAGLTAHAAENVSAPSDSTNASASASKSKTPLLNFDFPGGTIAQLVALMNSTDNGTINIIGEKNDLETPLPSFSFHNAELRALTDAVGTLLMQQDIYLTQTGTNTFTLHKRRASAPSAKTPPSPVSQAYQLAPYLVSLTPEVITDALREAWAFDPTHDPKLIRFKYHPATKLLFVYGPPEAIAMANQVIPQLSPTATVQQTPSRTPNESGARLESIADEVSRRREERQKNGASQSMPEKR